MNDLDRRITNLLGFRFAASQIPRMLLNEDIAYGHVAAGSEEADERLALYQSRTDEIHYTGYGGVHGGLPRRDLGA